MKAMDHHKHFVVVIEAIDTLGRMLVPVQNEYSHNMEAMYVEDEGLGRLKFNLTMVDEQLGDLRDYIEQYIKEEYYGD